MLYPSDGLNNITIGGPENHKVAVRFKAKHSAPLAAIRLYVINQKAGYAGGNGGHIRYALYDDIGGAPGKQIARGFESEDPEYSTWVGNGGFPLVVFPGAPILKASLHYHFVIVNNDPTPTVNFISADFLMTKGSAVNPDPDTSVLYSVPVSGVDAWTVYKTLIASPFNAFYANGSRQGNSGYQIDSAGNTQAGGNYGFGDW